MSLRDLLARLTAISARLDELAPAGWRAWMPGEAEALLDPAPHLLTLWHQWQALEAARVRRCGETATLSPVAVTVARRLEGAAA